MQSHSQAAIALVTHTYIHTYIHTFTHISFCSAILKLPSPSSLIRAASTEVDMGGLLQVLLPEMVKHIARGDGYVHTYMFVYARMFVCCIYVCVCMHVCLLHVLLPEMVNHIARGAGMCIHICIYVCECVYVCVYMHAEMYAVSACLYKGLCIYTLMHAMHKYIDTHTQV